MKLYQDPQAVNPRRVRVFLAARGIAVPTVDLSVLKGEHTQPITDDHANLKRWYEAVSARPSAGT